MNIHYALQTCDNMVRDSSLTRYCECSKAEITKKCVTSFLNSAKVLSENVPNIYQTIAIFDDNSSDETVNYLKECISYYSSDKIKIEFYRLNGVGLFGSVRACYNWLETNGKDLVYQVQDDYLFEPYALYEMSHIVSQIKNETDQAVLAFPFVHPLYYFDIYKYQSLERVIVPGIKQYWIQHFEIGCTFMTTKEEFSKHWDIYEDFFNGDLQDDQLEIKSFNRIFKERKTPFMQPFTSVALHMQSPADKDPYIDWQARWNNVPVLGSMQQS
jgi:hypothetical protein